MTVDTWVQGYEIERNGETLHVYLCYPRNDGDRARAVQVGLMDVRAADHVQVSYDFQRDGWSIKQASTFDWDVDDPVCDPDWKEVAFVQAWAREKKEQSE